MKLSAKRLSVLVALATKKGRRKYNSFIASGMRVVDEAVKAGQPIQYVAAAPSELTAPGRRFLEGLAEQKLFEISARDLRRIDGSESSQGIIAVITMPHVQAAGVIPKSDLVLVIDGISDPSNLGAILRSAFAFRFDHVILGNGCAELYSPKVIRASAGAVFHLKVATGVDLPGELPMFKSEGYLVVGTAPDGTAFDELSIGQGNFCLIVGNEATGISPPVASWCDEIVRIPTADRCESLSAPVAVGIAMYEISKRRRVRANRRNIERRKS